MKVLLPIDGSEPSQNTLAWATQVFNKETTQFYILTVVPNNVPELGVEEFQVEDALQILEKAKTLMAQKGLTVAKAEYIIGSPPDAICQYATEMNVDQIVIGSHGRSGLGKLLFGSVSTAVFENAKQPVFVFKNQSVAGVSA